MRAPLERYQPSPRRDEPRLTHPPQALGRFLGLPLLPGQPRPQAERDLEGRPVAAIERNQCDGGTDRPRNFVERLVRGPNDDRG